MIISGERAIYETVHAQDRGFDTLDPTTRRSLEELRRLLLLGEKEQVDRMLNRIINGSGYIEPLAEIYYKLAQDVEDLETLVGYYQTMIEKWENSPWAAKALVELIPLILMSGGRIDEDIEHLMWSKTPTLIQATEKASAIGEDPKLLKNDLFLNLVHLAHIQEDSARLSFLSQQIGASQSPIQTPIELVSAFANIRMQNYDQAALNIRQWMQNSPDPQLIPFALYALFFAVDTPAKQNEIYLQLNEDYADTLEALLVKKYVADE